MRLIARAPVELDGHDIRPGDTFEATEQQADRVLALGLAEKVELAPVDARQRKRATE